MSDEEKSNKEVRKYIKKDPYIRKDGTIVYTTRTSEYIPTGKPRGKPRTTESILIAEIKKLTDKEKEKVLKYLNKIKERRISNEDE